MRGGAGCLDIGK